MTPPYYIVCIFFTLFVCFACQPNNQLDTKWVVSDCQHANQLFQPGNHVTFSDVQIRVINNRIEQVYPIVSDNDRLIIYTQKEKWLFKINRSDSLMILTECYKNPEAIITLKTITQ
jgi:hypothetical protein